MTDKSKVYDCIMGVAVGDAFGFPYQFHKRGTFKVKNKMISGNGMPAGSWSDDTSLTLATMDSITACGGIDLEGMMMNFALWLRGGEFTPFGYSFDVGGGTAKGISRYISGFDVTECGLSDFSNNGNGSLMRILPLAFTPCTMDEIAAVSALTHGHEYSIHACQIQVAIAKRLLNGEGIAKALKNVMTSEPFCNFEEYKHLLNVGTMKRKEISGSGFVLHTLTAALWCLLKTTSYRECIMTAAGLGLDTDTVGAVAGGLAGIIYGSHGNRGIPKMWVKELNNRKLLREVIEDFEDSVYGDSIYF